SNIIYLRDNYKDDHYYYRIVVFTGYRKNSGTKSKIYFKVVGDRGETNVRIFSNETHQIFQRGQIDTFIMTVPKSLGSLHYIHIWHDNQNNQSSSSWF
ncbi:unnamed protein product, partial [Adineta steineri]